MLDLEKQIEQGIAEGLTVFTAKYDLDDAITNDLRTMLAHSMKTYVRPGAPAAASGAKSSDSKRTRRKTGYNLYIRAKFDAARSSAAEDPEAQSSNSQVLMSTFSKEWKGLSEDDKRPFLDEANSLNAENGTETASGKGKGKGKKSLSGYNLFYSKNKDNIREHLDKDAGEQLMKVVGAKWRALSNEEKLVWNKDAAEASANR